MPRKGVFYGWFILAASFFVLFVSTGARNGFGVFVIPMTDDLGWSRGTISLALALGWLVNGITQPFVGRIFDRFGGRKVITASLLVLGACTMLLSLTNSIWFLILVFSIVMSTAAGGASLVTVHALLVRWFYRKRGLVLSLSTTGASMGALVLAPFATYMILLAGWRVSWSVMGALILLLALPLAALLIKDNPSDVGELPDGDTDSDRVGTAPKRATGRRGPLEAESWRLSYKSRPMWQLTGAFFVCGATTGIISVHYVPMAIGRGVSPSTAALAFGLMSGLNILGAIAVGIMSDKVGRKNLLGTLYALRGLAYLMLILAPGSLALWGFAVIVGFSWIATAPLTTALTADIYGLRNMATLSGLASAAHQVGGALSIYGAGLLYDMLGSYDVPFAIAGALLVGASVAAFSIREKTYSSRYQPAAEAAIATASDGD